MIKLIEVGVGIILLVADNLSPDMTIDSLQQRIVEVLGKEVKITLKGTFAFWNSTCSVPEDCYF